ncbi:MAG: M50 family metallopeptidase [Alphaproteobacteria bacterium]|nr:M50 family metallopeptidase [Alphaproteobacteria bacterium]
MSNILDKIIELFKWPMAIISLLSIPALLETFSPLYFNFKTWKYVAMGGGFFIFFISRTMADSSIKTSMQITAHELTHAFFALITFHKVKHIKVAEDNSGGQIAFEGEGNWLITIAPYFFPLLAFGYAIATTVYQSFFEVSNSISLIINGFLGYFMGYHIDTVVSQIHEKQTDLPKVSYKFCFMFLPGANLWAIGSILAFNSLGWKGIGVYYNLVCKLNAANWNYLTKLLF